MKAVALAVLAAALASSISAAEAPVLVRTHYEVTIKRGRNTYTVGSGGNVSSGVSIKQDIGPYRLSLVPV